MERSFEKFENESLDALINHGLQALTASLQDGELEENSCTVGVVGEDMSFTLLEGQALQPYLAALKEENAGKLCDSRCLFVYTENHFGFLVKWPT